jgi:heme-degrading monooxygenase HmoA
MGGWLRKKRVDPIFPARYDVADIPSPLLSIPPERGRTMDGNVVLMVASDCEAAREDEFNKWYTGVHLPMFFKFEGLKKASRYRLRNENADCARYLAVYEFETELALAAFLESPAYKAAVEDFDRKWKTGGFIGKWAASYERLTLLER